MSDSALHVDPDDLTIGDLEDFKKVAGVSLQKAFPQTKDGAEDADIDPTALKALVWIVKRKADPSFSLTDARDVRITELHIGSGVPSEDPTPAAAGEQS